MMVALDATHDHRTSARGGLGLELREEQEAAEARSAEGVLPDS